MISNAIRLDAGNWSVWVEKLEMSHALMIYALQQADISLSQAFDERDVYIRKACCGPEGRSGILDTVHFSDFQRPASSDLLYLQRLQEDTTPLATLSGREEASGVQ